jgi:hypothetical protein
VKERGGGGGGGGGVLGAGGGDGGSVLDLSLSLPPSLSLSLSLSLWGLWDGVLLTPTKIECRLALVELGRDMAEISEEEEEG